MKTIDLKKYLFGLFGVKKEIPGELGFTAFFEKEIKRIGYSTNLTPEVVDRAIKNKIDAIITHHDVWKFMHGMKPACMNKLKRNGISHFFAHLPLDAAIGFGTNESLLCKLGAKAIERTTLYDGYYCGRIGIFEKPMKFSSLVAKLNSVCGERVMSWRNNGRPVKRIGVVTGGGSSTNDMKEFVDKKCDVYITGEKVLYTLQYAEFANINLIVGSHTFTEFFGVESLAREIKKHFPECRTIRLREKHFEL